MTSTTKPSNRRERTLAEYRAAMAADENASFYTSDEPCRWCAHPESAHTDMGCGCDCARFTDTGAVEDRD